MNILVGIWSRDTHLKQSENQGTRLYYLEEALKATEAKRASQASTHPMVGPIKSIFVAPEYLFSAEREDLAQARSLSYLTARVLKSMLAEMSADFPNMLIVPGSIIFKQLLSEVGEAKKEKAIKIIEKAKEKATATAFKTSDFSYLTNEDKNRLLRGGTVTALIKNRIYVFLNGAAVCSYGKHGDMQESIGTDHDSGGVFIPGLKAGLKPIEGINFGFEVCFDHQIGALRTLIKGAGTPPDIQIVCSAFVDNSIMNMVVRPGGFAIHASSLKEKSGIHYKPLVKPPTSRVHEALPMGDATAGFVTHLGDETVGGSDLSYYLINYTAKV